MSPQILISALVVTCFVATKTLVDNMRRRAARVTVVVIGAGPVGLTAAWVAATSGRADSLTLYEAQEKKVSTSWNLYTIPRW